MNQLAPLEVDWCIVTSSLCECRGRISPQQLPWVPCPQFGALPWCPQDYLPLFPFTKAKVALPLKT
jgi:hypothetical protein